MRKIIKLDLNCIFYTVFFSTVFLLLILQLNLFSFFIDSRLMQVYSGDGSYLAEIVQKLNSGATLNDLHSAYPNNYFIFANLINNILKLFFYKESYLLSVYSLLILNHFAFFIIILFAYKISVLYTKKKSLSFCIVLGIFIIPDILNYTFIFHPALLYLSFGIASIFYSLRYFFYLSFILSGLSFGSFYPGLIFTVFNFLCFFIYFFKQRNDKRNINELFNIIVIFAASFFFLNPNIYKFKNTFLSIFQNAYADVSNIASNGGIENFKIFFEMLSNEIFGFYFIFFIIPLAAILAKILLKKNFFNFTSQIPLIICIILFFFQLYNFKSYIQGPRYFFHFLPFFLILISICTLPIIELFNIFFKNKKIPILNIVFIIIFLVNCIPNYHKFEKNINIIKKIKTNPTVMAGNFFLNFETNYKVTVASGKYSYIPDVYRNAKFDYLVSDFFFRQKYSNERFDYIFLNNQRPGAFIWIDINGKIIEKNIENLGKYFLFNYGIKNIKREINFVKNLIDEKLGYVLIFQNKEVLIFKKIIE